METGFFCAGMWHVERSDVSEPEARDLWSGRPEDALLPVLKSCLETTAEVTDAGRSGPVFTTGQRLDDGRLYGPSPTANAPLLNPSLIAVKPRAPSAAFPKAEPKTVIDDREALMPSVEAIKRRIPSATFGTAASSTDGPVLLGYATPSVASSRDSLWDSGRPSPCGPLGPGPAAFKHVEPAAPSAIFPRAPRLDGVTSSIEAADRAEAQAALDVAAAYHATLPRKAAAAFALAERFARDDPARGDIADGAEASLLQPSDAFLSGRPSIPGGKWTPRPKAPPAPTPTEDGFSAQAPVLTPRYEAVHRRSPAASLGAPPGETVVSRKRVDHAPTRLGPGTYDITRAVAASSLRPRAPAAGFGPSPVTAVGRLSSGVDASVWRGPPDPEAIDAGLRHTKQRAPAASFSRAGLTAAPLMPTDPRDPPPMPRYDLVEPRPGTGAVAWKRPPRRPRSRRPTSAPSAPALPISYDAVLPSHPAYTFRPPPLPWSIPRERPLLDLDPRIDAVRPRVVSAPILPEGGAHVANAAERRLRGGTGGNRPEVPPVGSYALHAAWLFLQKHARAAAMHPESVTAALCAAADRFGGGAAVARAIVSATGLALEELAAAMEATRPRIPAWTFVPLPREPIHRLAVPQPGEYHSDAPWTLVRRRTPASIAWVHSSVELARTPRFPDPVPTTTRAAVGGYTPSLVLVEPAAPGVTFPREERRIMSTDVDPANWQVDMEGRILELDPGRVRDWLRWRKAPFVDFGAGLPRVPHRPRSDADRRAADRPLPDAEIGDVIRPRPGAVPDLARGRGHGDDDGTGDDGTGPRLGPGTYDLGQAGSPGRAVDFSRGTGHPSDGEGGPAAVCDGDRLVLDPQHAAVWPTAPRVLFPPLPPEAPASERPGPLTDYYDLSLALVRPAPPRPRDWESMITRGAEDDTHPGAGRPPLDPVFTLVESSAPARDFGRSAPRDLGPPSLAHVGDGDRLELDPRDAVTRWRPAEPPAMGARAGREDHPPRPGLTADLYYDPVYTGVDARVPTVRMSLPAPVAPTMWDDDGGDLRDYDARFTAVRPAGFGAHFTREAPRPTPAPCGDGDGDVLYLPYRPLVPNVSPAAPTGAPQPFGRAPERFPPATAAGDDGDVLLLSRDPSAGLGPAAPAAHFAAETGRYAPPAAAAASPALHASLFGDQPPRVYADGGGGVPRAVFGPTVHNDPPRPRSVYASAFGAGLGGRPDGQLGAAVASRVASGRALEDTIHHPWPSGQAEAAGGWRRAGPEALAAVGEHLAGGARNDLGAVLRHGREVDPPAARPAVRVFLSKRLAAMRPERGALAAAECIGRPAGGDYEPRGGAPGLDVVRIRAEQGGSGVVNALGDESNQAQDGARHARMMARVHGAARLAAEA